MNAYEASKLRKDGFPLKIDKFMNGLSFDDREAVAALHVYLIFIIPYLQCLHLRNSELFIFFLDLR